MYITINAQNGIHFMSLRRIITFLTNAEKHTIKLYLFLVYFLKFLSYYNVLDMRAQSCTIL